MLPKAAACLVLLALLGVFVAWRAQDPGAAKSLKIEQVPQPPHHELQIRLADALPVQEVTATASGPSYSPPGHQSL